MSTLPLLIRKFQKERWAGILLNSKSSTNILRQSPRVGSKIQNHTQMWTYRCCVKSINPFINPSGSNGSKFGCSLNTRTYTPETQSSRSSDGYDMLTCRSSLGISTKMSALMRSRTAHTCMHETMWYHITQLSVDSESAEECITIFKDSENYISLCGAVNIAPFC